MSPDMLSLDTAQQLVAKAVKLATEANTAVAAVVTDPAGHVIAAARMDGVSSVAMAIATRKAVTATVFKAPVGALIGMISKDELIMRALGAVSELMLLPGATPIVAGGRCLGAIGIAGAHYSQDQEMADQIASGA